MSTHDAMIEKVRKASSEAENEWTRLASSNAGNDQFKVGEVYVAETLGQVKARAAIRAVFEHLRDNALPFGVRQALNEALSDDPPPDDGERIFLAGVEKILEGLGK